jgi:hypothetical protein
MRAQEEMADVTAHATLLFAMTTTAVSGTARVASEQPFPFKGSRAQR